MNAVVYLDPFEPPPPITAPHSDQGLRFHDHGRELRRSLENVTNQKYTSVLSKPVTSNVASAPISKSKKFLNLTAGLRKPPEAAAKRTRKQSIARRIAAAERAGKTVTSVTTPE